MTTTKKMTQAEARAEAVRRWGPNARAYRASGRYLLGYMWINAAKANYPEFEFTGSAKESYEAAFAEADRRAALRTDQK